MSTLYLRGCVRKRKADLRGRLQFPITASTVELSYDNETKTNLGKRTLLHVRIQSL